MDVTTGSMGSTFTTLRFAPHEIPDLAKADWSAVARRVLIDPVTGLVELMTPSRDHENHADGAKLLVDRLSEAVGLGAALLGSTRWKLRPDDPDNTGSEPDACFWLGENADAWDRAWDRGPQARDAFEAVTPPDLVVEVERSNANPGKPAIYRSIGAAEMWRLDLDDGGSLQVRILDLQATGSPAPLEVSAVLPLCTPDFIREAVQLAARGRRGELNAMIAEAKAAIEANDLPQP